MSGLAVADGGSHSGHIDVGPPRSREVSAMTTRPFQQVDVFTAVPFKGNPVAVVLDAAAGWSRGSRCRPSRAGPISSETTFVCPCVGSGSGRLSAAHLHAARVSCPSPGNPTIGSAHAVLRHGLRAEAAGAAGPGMRQGARGDPRRGRAAVSCAARARSSPRRHRRSGRGGPPSALGVPAGDVLSRAAVVDAARCGSPSSSATPRRSPSSPRTCAR